MRRGPSDDTRQRVVIALATATRIAAGMLMGTAMAIYIARRGSPFAVSMVLSVFSVGLTFCSPIWGAIADVTGRRRALLLVIGGFSTLSVLPLAVTDGVWVPIGLRGLYAVFATGYGPVMLAIVSQRGGAEGRGRSIGFYNSARAAGLAGGQLGAGMLLGLVAPAPLYLAIAAISVVSTVAAVVIADPTPTPDRAPTLGEVAAEVRGRLLPAADDREHLKQNGLQWLYVALALRNMTILGIMSLMAPYLTEIVGVSEPVMGALLAVNSVAQVGVMVLFGRVADATGRKPLITAGMAASGVFALVAASMTVPDPLAGRIALGAVAFLVMAAAYSAMATGAIAFIGDVAPVSRESELMGLRFTAKGVGGILGPPLVGGLATLTTYRTAFLVGSLFAFAAAGLSAVALIESRSVAAVGDVSAADD